MNAGGSRSQRDVQPVVHDNPGGCTAQCGEHPHDQCRKLTRFEVRLTYLNEIDPCPAGVFDKPDEALEDFGRVVRYPQPIRQPPSVRYQTGNGTRDSRDCWH
jgi:hypothetical protein